MAVKIDGENLKIEDVIKVARNKEEVILTPEARKKVTECRDVIQKLVDEGEAIYGVTTGIGELAGIRVPPEYGEELQKRIIYSHAAGVGLPFSEENVRAAMLLRANVIAKGYSAVRIGVLETLIEMINKNVIPVIYQKGSIGTSGDLSPLSQMAEVVMGEGSAFYNGKRMSGKEAMDKAGIKTWKLSFKEGLGLINGSQMFTGSGVLSLYDSFKLLKNAQIASAMTLDVLQSPTRAFDPRVHSVRPFHGQITVAENIRRLIEGSEMIEKATRKKVQDAYSLRGVPQILGPSLDALHYVRKQIEIEMNSAADNPLFFPKDRAHLACANFHGQPIAMALDFLAIAVTEIADLSERHINRLLNPALNGGLPGFLVEGKGLNSGLMVAQYTAASLLSENRVLSHPSTVDNVSVSADQEDHVSMGPIAALKARAVVDNVTPVIAIEMMCAAQAMDFRTPLKPAKATGIAYKKIREVVPKLVEDRVLYPDIEKITTLVKENIILDAVEKEIGELSE